MNMDLQKCDWGFYDYNSDLETNMWKTLEGEIESVIVNMEAAANNNIVENNIIHPPRYVTYIHFSIYSLTIMYLIFLAMCMIRVYAMTLHYMDYITRKYH
jgi:hypothetical protein